MGKDPAFLFYYQDFIVGTQFMDNAGVGAYTKILCHLADKGRLPESIIKRLCNNDKDVIDQVKEKLIIDNNGEYYSKRLEEEVQKRKKFTESRRANRLKGDNQNLHIYLIQNKSNNLIKIGSSVDPRRRFIELQNQEKDELELICYTEKTKQSIENKIHKKFENYRRKGEWFDISPNHIIDHMNNHMSLQTTTHMSDHMGAHMENENENENKDVNECEIKDVNESWYLEQADFWIERAKKYYPSVTRDRNKFKEDIIKIVKVDKLKIEEVILIQDYLAEKPDTTGFNWFSQIGTPGKLRERSKNADKVKYWELILKDIFKEKEVKEPKWLKTYREANRINQERLKNEQK